MRPRRRPAASFRSALVVLPVLLAAASGPAAAQEPPTLPPTVEEELEVREVGVLADLPERLRGRGAEDLRASLRVVEEGVERSPVGVDALAAGTATAYGRVVVVVDRARCDARVAGAALAALGAAAERLVALGPVEIAELDDRLEPRGEPGRSAEAAAARLAELSRAACGARRGSEAPPASLAGADLRCDRRPCLMVWVGPGWASAAADGAPRPVDPAEVDPLARRLAGAGWAVLAAPVLPADDAEPRRRAAEPERRPGSDRHTFGVDVLDRAGERRPPATEEEYERFVGVEQAPLRRLVATTAGEYADRPDEVERALERLAGRSILWYRTDRPPAAEPPAVVVREPGEDGRRLRAAAWAPRAARDRE